MKRTQLYSEHIELKAKTVDFAGYEMPLYYDSIIGEHQHVRKHAGLFDVSHMGQIVVKGSDAAQFLKKIITRNINNKQYGDISYSLILNDEGQAIDDVLVYVLDFEYLIVVNASNRERIADWMSSKAQSFDVVVEDQSESLSMLAFQGPKVLDVIKQIGWNIDDIAYYQFEKIKYDTFDLLVSKTGYTGEEGVEIICSNKDIGYIWNNLLNFDRDIVKPIGLGARDTLRLEVGFSLYGHEIREDIHPFESNLKWALSSKEEFFGSKALFSKKHDRVLIGFEMIDRGVPRSLCEVYHGDKNIGFVTSGGYLPSLKKNMGLALIDATYKDESEIVVSIRTKMMKARVISYPFIQPFNKRNIEGGQNVRD